MASKVEVGRNRPAFAPVPAVQRAPAGWAIVLLGLATSVAMVCVGFRSQSLVSTTFDPYFFGEMGKSLARGDGFAPYGVLLHRRAPLYPLTIGALYFVFGEHAWLVQALQCVLFAATCWLVFDMGRQVFNARTGILAGVLCAAHPLLLRYVPDLHLETLLTFLFTLTVWASVRFERAPTVPHGVLLGATAALASLTKAVVVLYPALFVGVWLLNALRRPRPPGFRYPWGAIGAMFVTMAVVIGPWTVRNYRATGGHFVLISSGFSDAFLRGYIFSKTDYALLRRPPYTDAENETNAWFHAEARQAGTEWERDDYETDKLLNRVALEKLRAEPSLFVRKFLVGLVAFWYQMTSLANSLVTGLLALGALGLAAVGGVRGWREGRPVWLFVLPALQLNVLLAALLALGRYSAPVIPALLVASAYGLDTLWGSRAAARG
jgi:4-amino-4-deoxy-L-arabinose transferase-like glycosyltransferase